MRIETDSEDTESPPRDETPKPEVQFLNGTGVEKPSLLERIKFLFTGHGYKSDSSLRDAIKEYIVEPESFHSETDSVTNHERLLLSNILKLRDVKVVNVMIPRADIVAIDIDMPYEDLSALLAEKQYSRMPVYRGTLDDVIGTVHIKDIVAALATHQKPDLEALITDIPIVSPSMPILDLVLKMRNSRRHMALVVDEYGGIDGLVTIGDVIESIIGEVDDEHDTQDDDAQMRVNSDGTVLADARVLINEFEDQFGMLLEEDEREESDTLGGLVFDIAGRVPARGEIITHKSGMLFEVLEADSRRISRLKISQIPAPEEYAQHAE